jgi:hypothetical protein
MIEDWPISVDSFERTRRLLDLFLVSVLLDAGAGNEWSYKDNEGLVHSRSEGLAIASLEMFMGGLFSSDAELPHRVDGLALQQLTLDQLSRGLQVSDQNPIAGIEGRVGVLKRLGEALQNSDYFGRDARPGNMLGNHISLCKVPTDCHLQIIY